MNLLDQTSLFGKLTIILPGLICIVIAFIIKKSDGRIIAGFNALSPEKQKELRNKNYVQKTFYLALLISVPFFIAFLLSFAVKDIVLFDSIFKGTWVSFVIILLAGMFIINRSMKK